MELFKLSSTFYPSSSLRNFDTLIWTERYAEAGEFKLEFRNANSKELEALLPLGSLISHTGTKEVMIVENYEMSHEKDKSMLITVSGRSFETFLENRVTYNSLFPIYLSTTSGSTDKRDGVYVGITVGDYVMSILEYAFQTGTNKEVSNTLRVNELRLDTSPEDYPSGRGDVYSEALKALALLDAGLKNVRPNGSQTTLDLVLSDGLDKRNTVIFSAQNEDLENAKYFKTIKSYKNYIWLALPRQVNAEIRSSKLSVDKTGLERRSMYSEDSEALDGARSVGVGTAVYKLAQRLLAESLQLSMVQATISKTAKPKFKVDYDVGDIVTVQGEFETSQVMRVTEHILTVDNNGINGYPTLGALN
jgi:hypothetical protein